MPKESITVEVVVTPSAGRSALKLDNTGRLRIYVKAPPEKGRANSEVIKLLAKTLRIARDDISIVSGATSRKKLIKIQGVATRDALLAALGIEVQQSLP